MMKSSNRLCGLILGVSSALTLFHASVVAEDRVYQTSGTTLTGEITATSPNEISITVRGKAQTVPINAVDRVVFDNEPQGLTRAKESASKNQWEDADQQFKTIDPKQIESDVLKREYVYYQALIGAKLALSGKGDLKAPTGALVSFGKANGRSHHLYELCDVVGSLAVNLGQYGEAEKYYTAITNAPFDEYKLKGQYLLGTALLAQGKTAEAKTSFEKVSQATAADEGSQRYQKLATVASIRTDIQSGKAKEAVDQLNTLIANSDSSDNLLFGNIYNALGEAHLSLNEIPEAKLAFLHTDLLFSANPDNHAQALYFLSDLWGKTGDPQRAVDAKTRLKQNYPGSNWARK